MKGFIAILGAVVAFSLFSSPVVGQDCANSTSCEECVKIVDCFWCDAPASGHKQCQSVKNGQFLTDIQSCPGYNWKWGQCVLNGIVIAVLLALFLIFIIGVLCFLVCCIACCCRRRRKERVARAEYQYQREREAIKDEHARKREEKANRREEIKKKYGLFDDSGTQEN
jgi:uncharacterized membrane protein